MHQERELKISAMRTAIENGVRSGIDESFSFECLNYDSFISVIATPGGNRARLSFPAQQFRRRFRK